MILHKVVKIWLVSMFLVVTSPLCSTATEAEVAQADPHGGHEAKLNLFDFSEEGSHPLVAMLLNFAVLLGLVYWLLRKPLSKQFRERKETLERAIAEARETKSRAEAAIAEARAKMDEMGKEIERVREEMLAAGKMESEQIVAEATTRSQRMLDDTRALVEHEARKIAHAIKEETVGAIVETAERIIREKIEQGDHDRLTSEYIKGLIETSATSGGPGE